MKVEVKEGKRGSWVHAKLVERDGKLAAYNVTPETATARRPVGTYYEVITNSKGQHLVHEDNLRFEKIGPDKRRAACLVTKKNSKKKSKGSATKSKP